MLAIAVHIEINYDADRCLTLKINPIMQTTTLLLTSALSASIYLVTLGNIADADVV